MAVRGGIFESRDLHKKKKKSKIDGWIVDLKSVVKIDDSK